MKKKFIMALSTAFVAAALCGTLAACGEQTETKTGEYKYANPYNTTAPKYGVKVSVDVKGDKIESVKIVDSDYTEVSDGWSDKAIWNDGLEEFLGNFAGMKVSDVLNINVPVDVKGVPSKYDGNIISGASQGSGRVVLAIQNALGAEAKVTTVTGEYSYANPYSDKAPKYGVKVSVEVYAGEIKSVSIVDSDYTVVSDGWSEKAIWNDGIAKYLESFKDMKVADVLNASVEVNKNGEPQKNGVSGVEIITGATQGSGRLVLAIQNALGKENKVVVNTASVYGLVHKAGYVGVAIATVKGDKMTALELTEVCLPTYTSVRATEKTPEADRVPDQINNHGTLEDVFFYKTIKFDDYTFTYSAEKDDYVDADGKTFKEVMADEDACKAYYNAVVKGELAVVVNGEEKTDVMTYEKLSKEENGYWTKQDKDGNSYSRWQLNRDATVNYALENGVDCLLGLVQAKEKVQDEKGADALYWMDGDVSTGATWSDLNPAVSDGYFSYAELIVAAYEAAID